MIDRLDFVVRFWELQARHATAGYPLGAPDRRELVSLMKMTEEASPRDGDANRPRPELSALLVSDGKILRAKVLDVSTGGLVVASSSTLEPGARVEVRAADALSGVEYVLPCIAVRVRPGTPDVMWLIVDALPARRGQSRSQERRLRLPARCD